jgi:type VI protein secretion system component Hcp
MMATLLRRVGIKVRSIYQVYPKKKHESIQDTTWIELCGRKGWIAISGDKRLEKNIENLTAVIAHKVKVFILTDTNSIPEEWAAAVIVGQEKITSVINKNTGYLFSSIQRGSLSHVSHARFPRATRGNAA